jgi:hypothetical protein
MNRRPAKLYTAVSGIFLLIQGTSTLAFHLHPPLDRAFPALLDITQMIPVHSVLHIVTGIVAVTVLYRGGEHGAYGYALGFGAFYLLLGLAGLMSGLPLGLGLQPFDHPVHLVIGAAGLLAAYLSSPSKKPAP